MKHKFLFLILFLASASSSTLSSFAQSRMVPGAASHVVNGIRGLDGFTTSQYQSGGIANDVNAAPGCESDHMFTSYTTPLNTGNLIKYDTIYFTNLQPNPDTTEYRFSIKQHGAKIDTGAFLAPNSDPSFYIFPCATSDTGNYIITLYIHVSSPNGLFWQAIARAEINYINETKKVWIEAPEICTKEFTPPADDKYHFKVRTEPAINTIMYQTGKSYDGGATTGIPRSCTKSERIQLSFDFTQPPANSLPYLDQVSGSIDVTNSATGSTVQPGNKVYGSILNGYNPATINDFWVPYSYAGGGVLESYVINPQAGPVYLHLFYNDGVKTFEVTAPIIINRPLAGLNNYQASSAFHYTDLTVGNGLANDEVWTPTSSPATVLYGGGTQPVLRIQKELRIHSGTHLTIEDMTVEFGPEGRVIVEGNDAQQGNYGGYLKLKNSTLTAYRGCGNDEATWWGVQVHGHSNLSQEDLLVNHPKTPAQGMMEMNKSTISYAGWAIQLYDPWGGDYTSSSGGVFNAVNSTFLNNRRAIGYMPYDYHDPANPAQIRNYRSNLTDCDFIVNQPLPGGFAHHISGWANRGPRIYGCYFENTSGETSQLFDNAIAGFDFGTTVRASDMRRSTFNGFAKGVNIETIAGTPGFIKIFDAEFYDNGIGVNLSATEMANLQRNTFSVPPGHSSALRYAIGVNIEKSSLYELSSNTFRGAGVGAHNGNQCGVRIENGGSDESIVHWNIYTDLGTGNLSNELNRGANSFGQPAGLSFTCNNYNNSTFDEAARGTDPNHHGMKATQGEQSRAAGNAFNGGNGHQYEIYNDLHEVLPVDYYYFNSDPLQRPNAIFGSINAISTENPNDCQYLVSPSDDNDEGPLDPNLFVVSDGNGTTSTDVNALYALLGKYNTPYGRLAQVMLLINQSDYNNATTLYNSIATTYELDGVERDEFTDWGNQFMSLLIAKRQDGTPLNQLTRAQVATLESIAKGGKLWAKARAQNWLSLYDGRHYESLMLFPNIESAAALRGSASANRNQNSTAATGNSLYPNPVHNTLTIRYANKEEHAIFQLMDVTGKVLATQTLVGKSGTQTVDVSKLAAGIYLYKITEGNTTTKQGKVVKQ